MENVGFDGFSTSTLAFESFRWCAQELPGGVPSSEQPSSSPRVSFSEDVRSPPVSPPATGGLKLPFGSLVGSQSSGSSL